MALKTGTQLGAYEITAPLGAGGMGEVYRATDTKLKRDVAIKVLPEDVAQDPERLARFEREAKVLAQLEHTNIAAIYGLEETTPEGAAAPVRFLVMQLAEGRTLQERIAEGPVPVDEALPIAQQIAEGMEAAHEKGIVHRDLKPANIKVSEDAGGNPQVKILDFGLAKAYETDGTTAEISPDISATPTIAAATRAGMILGTAAYMSPEQARGKPVDRRADIWAFGCVLYEALTARQVFSGETASDTLAATLKDEPDLSRLPAGLPAAVRRLLARCLQKDPQRRLQHIGDARIEISDALLEPGADVEASVAGERQRDKAEATAQAVHGVSWSVAVPGAVALLLVGAAATWFLTRPGAATPAVPMRFDIGLAEGTNLPGGVGTNIAVSPDGRAIVYLAENASGRQLYLRRMNELSSTPIPGTKGGFRPFFSPDGDWVAFETENPAGIAKVSLSGDELYPLCDSCGNGFWGEDGKIIFDREGSLWQVSGIGGEPELLAKPVPERGVSWLSNPIMLPGNEAVLFENGYIEFGGIGVLSLESNKIIWVSAQGSSPIYSYTGHIIFPRGNTLVAVPFDVEGFEVTGPAVPVLQGVRVENGGAVQAAVSRNGLLVYAPAGTSMGTRLTWVDRSGEKLEPVSTQWRLFSAPRLSPDGEQIAVVINDGADTDIWIVEVGTGGMRPLTTSGDTSAPVWTLDGARVTFASGSVGSFAIEWTQADGSGPVETLLESEHRVWPEAWHADGRQLVFRENSTSNNLFVFDAQDRSREALLDSDFSEHSAALSHDGKWLAYESNKGGSNEVYVRPFPGPGPEVAVSIGGGNGPMWSVDDSELYYRKSEALHFMAASLQSDPRFRILGQERLFEGAPFWSVPLRAHYDVPADDQRFLVLNMRSADEEVAKINVVLNWFEELKQRLPAAGGRAAP